MTKPKPKTARISKNAGKTRTSMWLDNALRKMIDTQAEKEQRTFAFMAEALLRKGLGLKPIAPPVRPDKAAKPDVKSDAPIFG